VSKNVILDDVILNDTSYTTHNVRMSCDICHVCGAKLICRVHEELLCRVHEELICRVHIELICRVHIELICRVHEELTCRVHEELICRVHEEPHIPHTM